MTMRRTIVLDWPTAGSNFMEILTSFRTIRGRRWGFFDMLLVGRMHLNNMDTTMAL